MWGRKVVALFACPNGISGSPERSDTKDRKPI